MDEDRMEAGSTKKNVEQINLYRSYFKTIWSDSKPLARLFKTDSYCYLYDTGTNKIFKVKERVFDLLGKLIQKDTGSAIDEFIAEHSLEEFVNAAKEIKRAIEEERVLLTKNVTDFSLSDHFHDYEDLIDSSLEILFLELTENCNLRCDYCVYSSHVQYKRDHGRHRMNDKVLNRAVDYLHRHSYKNDKVSIAYYGGEPLLEFPLIESSVAYARSLMKKKEIQFSITTNATLLTREIAEFFFKNNFNVAVSLDGPEEIHDDYRKDHQGKGSYARSLLGLKNLFDVYGETFKDRIRLSMVYTPPFSGKRIDRIAELWSEISWLPKTIGLNITYPGQGTIPGERAQGCDIGEDKDLLQWAQERFWRKYTGKVRSLPIADSIIESRLTQLMQRPIFREPLSQYYLNGCCVPGVRRLFVSADGTFRVCERVPSDAPAVGHIDSGIDIGIIKKIYIQ